MDTLFYAAASARAPAELPAPAAAEGGVRGRGPGGACLPVRPAGGDREDKSHDETPEGAAKSLLLPATIKRDIKPPTGLSSKNRIILHDVHKITTTKKAKRERKISATDSACRMNSLNRGRTEHTSFHNCV